MVAKMTEEHKKALARGRRQAKAVRQYLDALAKDRRSTLDEDQLRERLETIEEEIANEDDRAARVELHQRKIDYEQQLEEVRETTSLEELREQFVDAVKDYSARKGISYMAWREEGVPAAVLREAGLKRSYNPPSQED